MDGKDKEAWEYMNDYFDRSGQFCIGCENLLSWHGDAVEPASTTCRLLESGHDPKDCPAVAHWLDFESRR